VLVVEMIFPDRRSATWLNRSGAIVTGMLFMAGCFLAWFTWTQIARTKVFHQPPFSPPRELVAIAVVGIALMIFGALRLRPSRSAGAAQPPPRAVISPLAATWAVLWYGLVLLAFGIAPQVPPLVAVAAALTVVTLLIVFIPRWVSSPGWTRRHAYWLIAGALAGSMAVSFIGFIGSDPRDLWFKIIVDVLALLGLYGLARNSLGGIEAEA
jgi:hypothetical protein